MLRDLSSIHYVITMLNQLIIYLCPAAIQLNYAIYSHKGATEVNYHQLSQTFGVPGELKTKMKLKLGTA